MMDTSCPVKVNVRIRPKKTEKSILSCNKDENNVQFLAVGDKGFVFDQIFEENVGQEDIYIETVKPLIHHVLKGFCCIVLAYGQTGTGKTYTMIGDTNENLEHAGLISRVINDIFELAPWESEKDNVKIEVSFVEIYNQKVFDLLGHNRSAQIIKNLKLDPSVFQEVKSPDEAQKLLQFGGRHRHVGKTKLNEKSSRSHAVFTIQYTIRNEESTTISKLYLVDLGGSESVKRTGNEGMARLEGININQSLLALRKVLISLSKNSISIPYRDSVLTSVLHDSLTTKNYICLIACVSPDKDDYSETMNTLRFAESTKQIKSRPEIEMILNKFKLQNPGVIESISSLVPIILPTPMKRKYDSVCTPLRPTKKILSQWNSNTMINNYTDHTNRKYNFFDLSEKFENDTCTTFDPSNISSSSLVEPVTNTYSPIVRKCTEAVEKKIDDYITLRLETVYKTRRSVKMAIRSPVKTPEMSKNVNCTNEMMTQLVKTINESVSQIIDSKLKLFKEVLPHRKLFADHSVNNENNLQFKCDSHRRSKRLSVKSNDREPIIITDITNIAPPKNVRRSLRISMIKTKSPEKCEFKVPVQRAVRAKKPKRVQDTLLCEMKSKSLLQHKSKILDLLNEGSESQIRMLSTIGPKTALQICMHRSLCGEFKNIDDLSKAPFWRGSQFKRFLEANYLI